MATNVNGGGQPLAAPVPVGCVGITATRRLTKPEYRRNEEVVLAEENK